MSFDPEKQYRCTIIRGKAKTALDDLLPAYAEILRTICPCQQSSFAAVFNRQLEGVLKISSKKTLNNHRTEIAGKLFGMYYTDNEGNVQISDRAVKLLDDGDQPAFFKDLCYKFQFPNGMDKINKIQRDIQNGLKIRQCAFIIRLLQLAVSAQVVLTKEEIGYYVLNALETLQGKIPPEEVLEMIIDRRRQGLQKYINPNGRRTGSYTHQHINETYNYMELANLIRISGQEIQLNIRENDAIRFIASSWNQPLSFDIYSYNITTADQRKKMYLDWQRFFSKKAENTPEGVFTTTVETLTGRDRSEVLGQDTIELGDEGELFVYNYEKDRVSDFNPRLISRVLLLGKTKGLGFDIQSVRARQGQNSDHAIYIEVKSTKRITSPDPASSSWSDSVTITRNEWVAADQHRQSYYLFRVYFTPEKTSVFVIEDPITKGDRGLINITPLAYRMDFRNNAGKFINFGSQN